MKTAITRRSSRLAWSLAALAWFGAALACTYVIAIVPADLAPLAGIPCGIGVVSLLCAVRCVRVALRGRVD